MLPSDLHPLPDALKQAAETHWQAIQSAAALTWDAARTEQALRVLACSRFVSEQLLKQPELLADLATADLWRACDEAEYETRLQVQLATVEQEAALLVLLRRFRRREMLRIVWRDLARTATLEDTTRELSALADACIRIALDWWHTRLVQTLGEPVSAEGRPQRLIVLGMGKLGAGELNLSSDIDLIFTYPEAGDTQGGRRSLSNQEFFTQLGQKLIQALDNHTADGQVFRVDMRLRPWGQSGALVLDFNALEHYYQSQGRDWERYAMIKARPITGDADEVARLMDMLRPFTYRRYIDYSAIESLRDMKGMIEREVRRKGMEDNIKLGAGGIREVEFIVQSFQLIRGGREPGLREPALLTVLQRLGEEHYLPLEAVAELEAAYRFLRNTEHALQAWEDRQTQNLPDSAEARAALAAALGFVDWPAFAQALQQQRDTVRRHFNRVVTGSDNADSDNPEAGNVWLMLWQDELGEAAARDALSAFADPEAVLARLKPLREGAALRMTQAVARQRLDRFMPLLLAAVAAASTPDETLRRILPLVEAVLRRTAYLVLLVENHGALEQLVRLCAASPWIAEQLSRHPALLDELLDPRTLYSLPDRQDLAQELRQHMLRLPLEDIEQQLDGLRYFRLAYGLRVAACEVSGTLPLMKVSDQLTWLAEALLEYTLELAWQDSLQRHGLPGGLGDDLRPFVVIGYGKLGGIELGHGSDLDLVFLYDAPPDALSRGSRPLENAAFFTRLGQRLIHLLTAQSTLGRLYEVDMRLRPSGASGLLVSSLAAFEDYQRQSAWTWEHQALVRSRPVAGSAALAQRFEALRTDLLCQPRDLPALRRDVAAMREKMREHLLSASERKAADDAPFALKQGVGGIVDIEFMMQYAVLAQAAAHPALAVFTDNVRILEALAQEGLLTGAEVDRLRAAWLDYRMAQHRLALQQQSDRVPAGEFLAHREAVRQQWQAWLASDD